ncbi:hypothetical protein HY634_03955 [Candidatus Uhrbacteria bacterium]|nr:hypothetical protein [Candidatus Uhrbacteria bacterium]
MHTQPLSTERTRETAPPHLAFAACAHCGQLPEGTPHRQDCFPTFQRALIARYPSLYDVVALEEASAIERIFQFWAGIIHALQRSFPHSADRCVERRWGEVCDYVERMLARHTRRPASA